MIISRRIGLTLTQLPAPARPIADIHRTKSCGGILRKRNSKLRRIMGTNLIPGAINNIQRVFLNCKAPAIQQFRHIDLLQRQQRLSWQRWPVHRPRQHQRETSLNKKKLKDEALQLNYCEQTQFSKVSSATKRRHETKHVSEARTFSASRQRVKFLPNKGDST